MAPDVTGFFDPATHSISYVVRDPGSTACAIVDPVLDYDAAAGRRSTASADRLIAHVQDQGLDVAWLIETHVHADHLSAAPYLKAKLGGRTGIGRRIVEVQETFGRVFGEDAAFARDGSQFDHLFADGETYRIGGLTGTALATPGHTPACMTHVIGDAAFVGDTLFMPDGGTARADFPGGDAATLYASIQRILALPDATRLFTGHDYAPGGRPIAWESTVAAQKAGNIHVGAGRTVGDFVDLRQARDAQLSVPALILPALQVNMRAGQVPPPATDGRHYLKVPLDTL